MTHNSYRKFVLSSLWQKQRIRNWLPIKVITIDVPIITIPITNQIMQAVESRHSTWLIKNQLFRCFFVHKSCLKFELVKCSAHDKFNWTWWNYKFHLSFNMINHDKSMKPHVWTMKITTVWISCEIQGEIAQLRALTNFWSEVSCRAMKNVERFWISMVTCHIVYIWSTNIDMGAS